MTSAYNNFPKYTIRTLTKNDIDQIMKVELSAWDEWIDPKENFYFRLEIFPEGCIGLFTNEGELVGSLYTMIKKVKEEDLYNVRESWDDITEKGTIKNHDPQGNCLYGVSLSVAKEYQGKQIGTKLIEAFKDLVVRKELDFFYFGARIPDFQKYILSKYDQKIPETKNILEKEANEYIHLTRTSDYKFLDMEMRFYRNYCNLKPIKVVPDFGPDSPSLNYGVIMVWKRDRLAKF
jgi:hypothetical protein